MLTKSNFLTFAPIVLLTLGYAYLSGFLFFINSSLIYFLSYKDFLISFIFISPLFVIIFTIYMFSENDFERIKYGFVFKFLLLLISGLVFIFLYRVDYLPLGAWLSALGFLIPYTVLWIVPRVMKNTIGSEAIRVAVFYLLALLAAFLLGISSWNASSNRSAGTTMSVGGHKDCILIAAFSDFAILRSKESGAIKKRLLIVPLKDGYQIKHDPVTKADHLNDTCGDGGAG